MPIALIITAILLGSTYVLIHAGYSQFHALTIVLGFSAVLMLIIFIILVLAVRDEAKLYKLFNAELSKCIHELKVFWDNLTNKQK